MNAYTEKVNKIVKEIVEPRLRDRVTPDGQLLGEKLIDSFGLIRLVGELEQAFGIAIRTEDLTIQSFGSINSISRLIERYTTVGIKE
jgi:acyl carrier protein